MNPKHTPLPWITGTLHPTRVLAFHAEARCVVAWCAQPDVEDSYLDIEKANADLIVRAVNNHQRLVDALTEARSALASILDCSSENVGDYVANNSEEFEDLGREALAAATSEQEFSK